MQYLIYSAIIVIISYTFATQRIFESIRIYLAKKANYNLFEYFLQCPYCQSIYVLAALYFITFDSFVIASWLLSAIVIKLFTYIDRN